MKLFPDFLSSKFNSAPCPPKPWRRWIRIPHSAFVSAIVCGLWTMVCPSVHAQNRLTLTITVTNNPSQSGTLVVNGDTRTWTTNQTGLSTTQFKINTNGNLSASATNMYSALVAQGFSGPINIAMTSSNVVKLYGQGGQSIIASLTGGWGTLALGTNLANDLTPVRVPFSLEQSSARVGIASNVVAGLNSYSPIRFILDLMPIGIVTNIAGNADLNVSTASGISTLSISNSSPLKALASNNASALTNVQSTALIGLIPVANMPWTPMQSTNDLRYVPLTRTLSVTGPITGGGDLSANRSVGFDGSQTFNIGGATNVPAANVVGTLPTSTFSTGGDARYQKLDGSNSGTGVYTNSAGYFVDNVFDTVLKKLFGNWTVTGTLVASNGFEFYGTGIIGTVGSSTTLTDNKVTLFNTNTYFAKTATFSNSVVALDNITGSGTDNTLNSQTLTGNGSVMTRTLADTRYLSTYSPITYCMVQSGDSVSLTNSSIGLGMIYGASANILNVPTTTNQWLKSVYVALQDSGTFVLSNGITNMSLRIRCTLNDNTIITIQDWVNANVFRGGGSFNQFSGKWFFTNETVWITNANAYQIRHELRFDGIVSNVTARLPSVANWYTTYPY